MTLLYALIPFGVLFFLILGLKWKTLTAVPITVLVSVLVLHFHWSMPYSALIPAFSTGVLESAEILLLVLGALILLYLLEMSGNLDILKRYLIGTSPDLRVQVLIVAFLFGSLIEGVAGFGTPIILVVPILIALGVSPLSSLIITLVANSVTISFGAAGTPLISGLIGFSDIGLISGLVSLLHAIGLMFLLPCVLVLVSRLGLNRTWKQSFSDTWDVRRLLFLVWLSYCIPFVLTAWLLGPELPAIAGALSGLIATIYAARIDIIEPKVPLSLHTKKVVDPEFHFVFRAFIPYLAIVALLFLSRTIVPLHEFLKSYNFTITSPFFAHGQYNYHYLYAPPIFFLTGILIAVFLYKISFKEIMASATRGLNKIKKPAIALTAMIVFAQLLLISEHNPLGVPGVSDTLAQAATFLFGKMYYFVAPAIGAFGAFVAGSNTVSNLLFAKLQASSAVALDLSVVMVLALQVAGGAIGCMMSLHNIIAGTSVIHEHIDESEVLKKVFVPCALYVFILGLSGMIIAAFFFF